VTIPEEDITRHLNYLLEQADPGDSMHHLIVVADENYGKVGPLGLPAEPKPSVSFFMLAADQSVEPVEVFIAKAIAGVALDHTSRGETIVFAALSQEVWAIEDPDEADHKQIAAGRLNENPDAAEATFVYGASRDGRRWHSRRWVSGPKAGQTEDVDIITGPVVGPEMFGLRTGVLMRRLVGQRQ
jgi:hypothetical protein